LSHILKTAVRATALAAFAMVSASAFADFDANIEFDNTYGNNSRGLSQSGRVELNASKKMGSQYFIAGKASYLALKSGGLATDDMWVQLGNQTVDVKLGRFEATNLFQTPGDTIIEVAGQGAIISNQGAAYSGPYAANALRGRTGGNVFQGAATVQLGGGLSFELGVVETKQNGVGQTNAGTAKGLRPILSYANGPLHVAAGAEAIKYANGRNETGYGLTGDYDFGGFKLTANLTGGKSDLGYKQSAYGLIAQVGGFTAGLLAGAHEMAAGDDYKVMTFYTSYAIPFFDIKGATVTPALSFSKGSGANTADDSIGAKVRINYAF
jgi:hypothetical protein